VSGWDAWRHLDPSTPVIVGAAAVAQDLDEPGAGDGALALMTAATLAAGRDSGSARLLAEVQLILVPGGSWTYRDPGRAIANTIGASGAHTVVMAAGVPQQTLFDDAFLDVSSGRIDVALVVGGEAAHRTAVARRAGIELAETVDDGEPDELRTPQGEMVSPIELAAGVYSPVQVFALIDSALRAAEGRTIDQHREEIAGLWAGFSAVAASFAGAAFRDAKSAAFIREPSADNRAIAFPYNKWHCSQMNVDQAAAILVCSLRAAEASGVDPSRVVFPLVALESSFSLAVPRRRDLHRWPAMEVLGDAAAAHLGAPLSEIELTEVYSCFPAAVRVQQRALRLPVDQAPTITGGEPFAGGPWNNFVLQATVAMIDRLRAAPGARGMVTTVSGFLNKPGLAVYSSTPGRAPLLVADLAEEARAATPTVDLAEDHHGQATIAACTVSYDRTGAPQVIVLADTPEGTRALAVSSDPTIAERAVTEELIGSPVRIDGTQFHV
jgi:acetyl-CoA C-acetyltransferase